MARVISRDSIIKANDTVRKGRSCVVGRDSKAISARIRTSFGTRNITFYNSDIRDASFKAMRNANKR